MRPDGEENGKPRCKNRDQKKQGNYNKDIERRKGKWENENKENGKL